MAIETIESLRRQLHYAMMVEHTTVPTYLCALYSIPDDTNDEAAAVIQTVAMEEMLHMTLVANLTNAVGGETRVNWPEFVPNYPEPLRKFANGLTVELLKFSTQALDLFLKIEKPESIPDTPSARSAGKRVRYTSIGEFYADVRGSLKALVDKFGEKKVFSGDPALQVTPEYYYGGAGHIFLISNLEEAELAIREIVDQGEGLPGQIAVEQVRDATQVRPVSQEINDDSEFLAKRYSGESEPAHYFRFKEIRDGRYYQKGDTVDTGPRGPEFPVDWSAAWNMTPNPSVKQFDEHPDVQKKMQEFNRCYTRLLDRLQLAFTGHQSELVAGVGDMYELKHRAVELMRIPNPLDDGATTVGPGFEFADDR